MKWLLLAGAGFCLLFCYAAELSAWYYAWKDQRTHRTVKAKLRK
jgi:hypothetical protein